MSPHFSSRSHLKPGGVIRHLRADGILVLLAEDHRLPRLGVRIVARNGANLDSAAQCGLTHLQGELALRGTRHLGRKEFSTRYESLGSALQIDAGIESQSFGCESLTRYFPDTFALLSQVLLEPAFAPLELEKLVRETEAEQQLRIDDDAYLARYFLRHFAYPSHPYGRDLLGTQASLARIDVQDIAQAHAARVTKPHLIVTAAGDIDLTTLNQLIDRDLAALPTTPCPVPSHAPSEDLAQRLQIYLIDKPERTQTQIAIATRALSTAHPDFLALQVATCAFGGTFTSPLMHEVREVRGWSYGASADVSEGRERGSLTLCAAPSERDAVPCLLLMLSLYQRFLAGDFPLETYAFAKRYLMNQYPFAIATPDAQMAEYLNAELLGLPADWPDHTLSRLSALEPELLRAMPARHLSAEALVVVIVCSAQTLEAPLKAAISPECVQVIPYDQAV